MANHQSAKKRARQAEKKRLHNRYYKKTTRTAIAKLREMEDQSEASKFYPKVTSMIDKLARQGQWHHKKASNLKSKLAKHIHSLA